MFKSTGNKPIVIMYDVMDTQCKSDITATFKAHWENNNTTLWPCIRLTEEQASKGKFKETQRRQAMSYLHYLLLTRRRTGVTHFKKQDHVFFWDWRLWHMPLFCLLEEQEPLQVDVCICLLALRPRLFWRSILCSNGLQSTEELGGIYYSNHHQCRWHGCKEAIDCLGFFLYMPGIHMNPAPISFRIWHQTLRSVAKFWRWSKTNCAELELILTSTLSSLSFISQRR